ncbi:MAG: hypothetical protein AAGA35_00945 [Patescibacteria group bacterium]
MRNIITSPQTKTASDEIVEAQKSEILLIMTSTLERQGKGAQLQTLTELAEECSMALAAEATVQGLCGDPFDEEQLRDAVLGWLLCKVGGFSDNPENKTVH